MCVCVCVCVRMYVHVVVYACSAHVCMYTKYSQSDGGSNCVHDKEAGLRHVPSSAGFADVGIQLKRNKMVLLEDSAQPSKLNNY